MDVYRITDYNSIIQISTTQAAYDVHIYWNRYFAVGYECIF